MYVSQEGTDTPPRRDEEEGPSAVTTSPIMISATAYRYSSGYLGYDFPTAWPFMDTVRFDFAQGGTHYFSSLVYKLVPTEIQAYWYI